MFYVFFTAPKPMQDGWGGGGGGGGGGEELNMQGGQWDAEDGDMWNNSASHENNSSCNSWGNASKKGPPKVRRRAICIQSINLTHKKKM